MTMLEKAEKARELRKARREAKAQVEAQRDQIDAAVEKRLGVSNEVLNYELKRTALQIIGLFILFVAGGALIVFLISLFA